MTGRNRDATREIKFDYMFIECLVAGLSGGLCDFVSVDVDVLLFGISRWTTELFGLCCT